MSLDPVAVAGVVAAGVAAGFVNTVAGGGSLLTLPALMLAGLPADLANGTNRLSVVAQSASGAAGFARRGRLDRSRIPRAAVPVVLGALVGASAAAQVPAEILELVLVAVMVGVAVLFAFRDGSAPAEAVADRPVWTALGMFGAGVYGGFIQAGVGFALLAVLGGMMGLDLVRANALKLVCTLLLGIASLAVFAVAGQVVWLPAALLAVATVVGSQLGVRFAVGVSPTVLRRVVLAWVVVCCVVVLTR